MFVLSRLYCCPCNIISCGAYDAGYCRTPKPFGRIHVTRAVSNRRRHDTIASDELDWNVRGEEDLPPKPLGFGHGKSYDTSLEDKILEEIERDKAARSTNFMKRNKSAGSQGDSKIEDKGKNTDFPSSAMTVKIKISDLPKKKNIKRDLLSAFRNVPGLLEVIPSVLGNEKTRDPVCKGFGFLTFDNYEHAKCFISSYGDEPIQFGKVMKQPSYRILDGDCTEISLELDMPSSEKENLLLLNSSSAPQTEQVSQLQTNEVSDLDVLQNNVFLEENYSYGEDEVDSDDEYGLENDIKLEAFLGGNQNLEVVDRSLKNNDDCDRPVKIDKKTVDVNEFESRINDLENRLMKKFEEGRSVVGTNKKESEKSRGFKVHRSKKNPTKDNNLTAVTNKLKKNERTIMIGVLEKYGKHQTNCMS